MAEPKKKKKIVSADTGEEITGKKAKKKVVEAAPVGNAGGLRAGAVILWIVALVFEVLAYFVFTGKIYWKILPSMYLLVAFLVLDLVCVIVGAQFWKKANHIKPASEKNKVKSDMKQIRELLSEVERLNMDDDVSGIIVQLPLPKHLDEQIVINHISNAKDADGFGLLNKGKLFSGLPCLRPATPLGIMYLLDKYNINLEGKRAVVIGRSNIVGKPMALMLLEKNATVTIAHSRTKNLKELTKEADVLVVAIGKAKFVTEDMVKDGAVIVDVGINRVDGVLYGDVDFENVEKKASYITPVPGGVGPLTIAMLLLNTVTAFIEQNK